MHTENRWLLPEGIEEILPPRAARLERLCRDLIDLYTCWGYELVLPPMIEYLESLLTGTGEDLDLQTFKLTDQLSGRMMGIRADITPQVARIDAHVLRRNVPTRLCYLGSVLHARPSFPGDGRSPLQIGAELYGHSGAASDAEILSLMLETMRLANITDLHIDISHAGIYQSLINTSDLNSRQQSLVFDALQRKAVAELEQMFGDWNTAADVAGSFIELLHLSGGHEVLQRARQTIGKHSGIITDCLAELEQITSLADDYADNVTVNFDLAELRGYHYHTGIIFTAYGPGQGQGIAFGGRYDDIGAAFGRARPATGFSTDIKTLQTLQADDHSQPDAIFAPCCNDQKLIEQINLLRRRGETVIRELPDQNCGAGDMQCRRMLEQKGGNWRVVDA